MSEFRPAAMSKTTSALNRATGGSHSGGYAGSSGKGLGSLMMYRLLKRTVFPQVNLSLIVYLVAV